ncbi:hypothetical protein [Sphingobium sp.]|uniref:hypothetical protein n=1 Tax=Sphingobium sp. TaxID=1912891 RepID=UPI003BB4E815
MSSISGGEHCDGQPRKKPCSISIGGSWRVSLSGPPEPHNAPQLQVKKIIKQNLKKKNTKGKSEEETDLI